MGWQGVCVNAVLGEGAGSSKFALYKETPFPGTSMVQQAQPASLRVLGSDSGERDSTWLLAWVALFFPVETPSNLPTHRGDAARPRAAWLFRDR